MEHKPKILVVDDDRASLNALVRLLSTRYDIVEAQSAKEAEDILRYNFEIRVILVDNVMPGKSGLELLAGLRSCKNIFKILMTAYHDVNTVIEAINFARVDYFIIKPIDYRELFKILDSVLSPAKLETLTKKERQIVSLMISGASQSEIANLLRISPITLSVHKGNILKKLHLDKDSAFTAALVSKLPGNALSR